MKARRLMPIGLGVLAIMAMLVAALAANAAPSKSNQNAKSRDRHGYRRPERQGLQPPLVRRPAEGSEAVEHPGPHVHHELGQRPHAEPGCGCSAGLRPRRRRSASSLPLDRSTRSRRSSRTRSSRVSTSTGQTLSLEAANVRGIQFKEQEAGYLAGYIAGSGGQGPARFSTSSRPSARTRSRRS